MKKEYKVTWTRVFTYNEETTVRAENEKDAIELAQKLGPDISDISDCKTMDVIVEEIKYEQRQ